MPESLPETLSVYETDVVAGREVRALRYFGYVALLQLIKTACDFRGREAGGKGSKDCGIASKECGSELDGVSSSSSRYRRRR
jgi:hypothetical protein